MMIGLLPTPASEALYIMLKSTPTTYCEQRETDNADQALRGMLDTLRKPLKLTATLRRRALKRKVDGKSVAAGPSRYSKP
jgi:hypothetical protein